MPRKSTAPPAQLDADWAEREQHLPDPPAEPTAPAPVGALRCVMCDRTWRPTAWSTKSDARCPHCGFGKGIPNTGRDR